MALIFMFSYFSQANANTQRQVFMLRRVLEMELANLDSTWKNCARFPFSSEITRLLWDLVIRPHRSIIPSARL
jgi:hypothetical protein